MKGRVDYRWLQNGLEPRSPKLKRPAGSLTKRFTVRDLLQARGALLYYQPHALLFLFVNAKARELPPLCGKLSKACAFDWSFPCGTRFYLISDVVRNAAMATAPEGRRTQKLGKVGDSSAMPGTKSLRSEVEASRAGSGEERRSSRYHGQNQRVGNLPQSHLLRESCLNLGLCNTQTSQTCAFDLLFIGPTTSLHHLFWCSCFRLVLLL